MDEMKSTKKLRGFATMSVEERRKIAQLGGMSVKPENRSFSTNRQLASDAGRRGGKSQARVRGPNK